MPKITKATRQKSNPERINLFVDNKFLTGIHEAAWVSNKLRINEEIPKELLTKLKSQSQKDKVYEKALKLLGIRLQSSHEMKQKLLKKFEPQTVNLTIERLKQEKLLDDRIFATAWIESRSKNHLRSKLHLISELKQKGINNELIQSTLQQSQTEENEIEAALILAQKKMRQLDINEISEKVKTYLARKGFRYNTILEIERRLKN